MASAHGDKTYGEILRDTILFGLEERRSVRQVARDTEYSYEHVRKACRGNLSFTREFNDVISAYLGLDADDMWRLAQTERMRIRYAGADFDADMPRDGRIKAIYESLSADQRKVWIQIGEGYVAQNEAMQEQGVKLKDRPRLSEHTASR